MGQCHCWWFLCKFLLTRVKNFFYRKKLSSRAIDYKKIFWKILWFGTPPTISNPFFLIDHPVDKNSKKVQNLALKWFHPLIEAYSNRINAVNKIINAVVIENSKTALELALQVDKFLDGLDPNLDEFKNVWLSLKIST